MTAACIILSFEGSESLRFSRGSLLVLLACVCWGFENNCTRRISGSDALQIVVIKGIGSVLGSLGIALLLREPFPPALCIIAALLLGFVAYGLSIFCYIRAQRTLGAAKTSTHYAIAPFIGTTLSLIMFRQMPGAAFLTGLAFMLAGTYLAVRDESAG
ncbi:MAG: DMT family transporter [Firmicutes bacterium]|nr:DMT family transporter [Bacillota bacterium]